MWRLQAVAAVLGRPRQEDRHELKDSQGYKVRSCFKSPVKQKTSHSLAVWGFPPCKGPSGSLAQAGVGGQTPVPGKLLCVLQGLRRNMLPCPSQCSISHAVLGEPAMHSDMQLESLNSRG